MHNFNHVSHRKSATYPNGVNENFCDYIYVFPNSANYIRRIFLVWDEVSLQCVPFEWFDPQFDVFFRVVLHPRANSVRCLFSFVGNDGVPHTIGKIFLSPLSFSATMEDINRLYVPQFRSLNRKIWRILSTFNFYQRMEENIYSRQVL